MSDLSLPSIVIFAVFGVMALSVSVILVLTVIERILPFIERRTGGASLGGLFGGMFAGWRHRRHEEDADDDDLCDETAALLSLVSRAAVVVDDHDEVVRANPEAYRLGVVADDELSDPVVVDAVHQVRAKGGRRSFDIETCTPERFMSDKADNADNKVHAGGGTGVAGAKPVTRPNWLTITVGRINSRFIVILLDDVSDAIRFGQVRDSFIVNVSEQLLKPTEALERLSARLETEHLDETKVRNDAAEVYATSAHLNHLVTDLLLLIKAQEPITPSTVNRLSVMDQLHAVESRMRKAAEDAGVRLVVAGDETLTVNGEADQIRAAVVKLVENAIAYSPEGGTVSVSAKRSDDGSHAVIRVIDQGKGVAKEEQGRIFERFYRGADQTERSADGVGLGLAIVKHVALTHHGTVSVWSVPGSGSTFSLSLPLAR